MDTERINWTDFKKMTPEEIREKGNFDLYFNGEYICSIVACRNDYARECCHQAGYLSGMIPYEPVCVGGE